MKDDLEFQINITYGSQCQMDFGKCIDLVNGGSMNRTGDYPFFSYLNQTKRLSK